jgi:hypothetical protein
MTEQPNKQDLIDQIITDNPTVMVSKMRRHRKRETYIRIAKAAPTNEPVPTEAKDESSPVQPDPCPEPPKNGS